MKKPKIYPDWTAEEVDAAEAQIDESSKRIEFYVTEYSVELLAQKLQRGQLVVPEYQRKFTWEATRKSRFIESLLLGLPVPFLFFWQQPDGRLEIVDGSQRLRTIEEFVLGDFRLGELERLTLSSGFRYCDLPVSRQMKIVNKSIRGVVLNERADEQARLDMFDRINTGSQIARPAEVRRGALKGHFMNLTIELANEPAFVALAPISSASKDKREREELVTRFFAYGDGLEGYRDRPTEFMFDYVKSMNQRVVQDTTLLDSYRHRFVETMIFVGQVFPYGFRKSAKSAATPRARFEAIAIGTRLALDDRPALRPSDVPNVASWLDSDEFNDVTGSDGANVTKKLINRLGFVRRKLLGQ